ncbi:hypothetical protein MASR1M42_04980 [Azonexus hydrophilus]
MFKAVVGVAAIVQMGERAFFQQHDKILLARRGKGERRLPVAATGHQEGGEKNCAKSR